MKILLTAAALVAFTLSLSPASAAMMACTKDNMMKSAAMMGAPDTPAKMASNKEMAMANADMSNGKMKSACMHYMKSQKAMMAK
ncbi:MULTISPECIES: hypothetical protein [Bradyrhizobium]|uniref:Pentapeptide MXKDX repeat protein n=1 Tax=Bradyrhizobium nanningense TaxID=1325118 RepID=A0A4Q0SFJ0_9BRAD|nr:MULTISPECIES: hypothetical protein [Bradyrhizobium]RXH36919.1 hypothetical protein XH84_01165 [Bradyrhizobium nanningense]RXH37187.1 hypothetical protein XH99_03315 [Bradyrhizobium nanningense]TQF32088.1 hypothetical protein UNPA324_22590 [Bradyrhizobium sp. UNPA324]